MVPAVTVTVSEAAWNPGAEATRVILPAGTLFSAKAPLLPVTAVSPPPLTLAPEMAFPLLSKTLPAIAPELSGASWIVGTLPVLPAVTVALWDAL